MDVRSLSPRDALVALLDLEPRAGLLELLDDGARIAALGNRELVFCNDLAELRATRANGGTDPSGVYVLLSDWVAIPPVGVLEPLEPEEGDPVGDPFVVGARVRFIVSVDRFPFFVVPSGATGTVSYVDPGSILEVKLDRDVPGSEGWDGVVQWSIANGDRPGEALEPLPAQVTMGGVGLELETVRDLVAWVDRLPARDRRDWRASLLDSWRCGDTRLPTAVYRLRNAHGPAWLQVVSDRDLETAREALR